MSRSISRREYLKAVGIILGAVGVAIFLPRYYYDWLLDIATAAFIIGALLITWGVKRLWQQFQARRDPVMTMEEAAFFIAPAGFVVEFEYEGEAICTFCGDVADGHLGNDPICLRCNRETEEEKGTSK